MSNKDLSAMRARSKSPTPTPASEDPAADAASATATVVAAPKRDKFAAKAARQQALRNAEVPAVAAAAAAAATAPRRDKFAAKAARQQQQDAAPRRDKFAAVASRGNSKFAAMAQKESRNNGITTTTASTGVTVTSSQDKLVAARRRRQLLQERQKAWDDLKKAEDCISNLLKQVADHGLFDPASLKESQKQEKRATRQAKRTARMKKAEEKAAKAAAKAAAAMDIDDDDDEGDESDDSDEDDMDEDDDDSLSEEGDDDEASKGRPHERYSKTLQEIHSLCAPHAHWIQAYRPLNNALSNESRKDKKPVDSTNATISMYQARVEMRLAQEKRNICQEWLRLEQQEMAKLEKTAIKEGDVQPPGDGDSKKRKLGA